MMVEQLLVLGTLRVRPAAPARARTRACASPRERRPSFSFEPIVSRARPPPRRSRTSGARAERPSATLESGRSFGVGLFLIAASLNSPLETIAAQAAAAHPSAAERVDRRSGPAAHPARAHASAMRDWLDTHTACWRPPPAPARCRGGSQVRYGVPHRGLLRLGAAHPGWARQHRARAAHPRRSPRSGGRSSPGRLSPPPALAYLGAGFVGSSFLGLALIFSSRLFYSFYEARSPALGPVACQPTNLGGIVMNGEQTLVFLLADRLVCLAAARRRSDQRGG